MATRNLIAIEHCDGTVESIHCHLDGTLMCNGKTLSEHYSSRDRVKALIALGNLSELTPRLHPVGEHSFQNREPGTTVAKHRDRGDEWQEVGPLEFCGLNALLCEIGRIDAEYVYVFTRDDRWVYSKCRDARSAECLQDVATAIAAAEIMGGGRIASTTRKDALPQAEGDYRYRQEATGTPSVYTATVMKDESGEWWVSLFRADALVTTIEYERHIRGWENTEMTDPFPKNVVWERIEVQPLPSGWLGTLPRQNGHYWAFHKDTGRYLLANVRWTRAGCFNIRFTDDSAVMKPSNGLLGGYLWFPIVLPAAPENTT